jgi:hypothetical protein
MEKMVAKCTFFTSVNEVVLEQYITPGAGYAKGRGTEHHHAPKTSCLTARLAATIFWWVFGEKFTVCSKAEEAGQSAGGRDHLFVVGYVLFLCIALGYLFRSFIFSDLMLRSSDIIGGGIFFRSFLQHAVSTGGGVPQWNPLQCCGLPFVAAIHGGAYYPGTYLELALGLFRGFGYSFILHFLLAGLFAFWAARQMGLSRLAASVVGVSYGLSPCLVSWVAPGHDGKIYVATWFPLIIALAERVWRGSRLSDVAWLGLVIAITVLTPHLQLAYYALWFLAAFSLWHVAAALRRRPQLIAQRPLRHSLLIGLAVLIGLLISSIQILPSYDYILHDTPRASVFRGPEYASQFANHAEEIISLAIPEFCGNNVRPTPNLYWGRNSFKDNSDAASAIAVYLAVLALVLPGRKARYFWVLVTAGVLLYTLGDVTPVFRWILAVIPALSSMEAPSGATFIAIFAISMLAGMAIDAIRNAAPVTPRRRKLILAAVIIPPVIMVVIDAFIRFDGEQTLRLYAQLLYPDLLSGTLGQAGAWARAKGNLPNLAAGTYVAAISLAATGVIVWITYVRKKWMAALWLVPVLIATVSVRFNERFINVFDRNSLLAPTAIEQAIAQRAGNWRAMEYDVAPALFDLACEGVASPTGRQERIPFEYFWLIGEYSRFHAHNPRLLNLTGTRFLIASQNSNISPTALGPRTLDTIMQDSGQILLENRNCFPRAFLASSTQVLPNNRRIIELVLNGDGNLRHQVYLEEQPQLRLSDSADSMGEASILYYGSDSIEIAVNSPRNSILVLTDNYRPSWTASGDGMPLRVYRADGAFRAVEVAAGTKHIVFAYHSKWIRAGQHLAYTGLILAAFLLVWQWARRPKPVQSEVQNSAKKSTPDGNA